MPENTSKELSATYEKFKSELGAPVGGTIDAGTGRGKRSGNWTKQEYEKGVIYTSTSAEDQNVRSYAVYGAIYTRYKELEAEKGVLGYPQTSETDTADGKGRYNDFENGVIYWTQATGAYEVLNLILDKWTSLGRWKGYLGYPLSGQGITPDNIGRYSHFQGGSIYYQMTTTGHVGQQTPPKPNKVFVIHEKIREEWRRLGWEHGSLGYPTSDTKGYTEDMTTAILSNDFQNGRITWSQTSGYVVLDKKELSFIKTYEKFKSELGALVGGVISIGTKQNTKWEKQEYTKGVIYTSVSVANQDAHSYAVYGAIFTRYKELEMEKGILGCPKTSEADTADGKGRYNEFETGVIYWTQATGAYEVVTLIRDKWTSLGGVKGYLGYPLSGQGITPDNIGRYSHFQGGSIYYQVTDTPPTHGKAFVIHEKIREEWRRLGWEHGSLGYPTSDTKGYTEDMTTAILSNDFQNGRITWSQKSGYVVLDKKEVSLQDTYEIFKSELGKPVGGVISMGTNMKQDTRWTKQEYEKGAIYTSVLVKSQVVRSYAVYGAIYTRYKELNEQKGILKFPKTSEADTADGKGRYNDFESGAIYWTATTGAYEVVTLIRDKWASLGGVKGYLGYPLSGQGITPDNVGRYSHFQGGSIYYQVTGTPPTHGKAFVVHEKIREEWRRLGWEHGSLRYPTSDTKGYTGDMTTAILSNDFQDGRITWSKTGGYKVESFLKEIYVPGTPVNKPLINIKGKNFTGSSNGVPANNSSCIGYGYNAIKSSYLCEEYVMWNSPILLLDANAIKTVEGGVANASNVECATEESIREVMRKSNKTVSIGAGYLLFSGSAKADFTSEEKSSTLNTYTKVKGIHRKERLFFKYSIDDCKRFMNPDFKRDLNGNKNPNELFSQYGTHLILDVYMGGRVEVNLTRNKSMKETTNSVRLKMEASLVGPISASGSFTSETTTQVVDAWSNSVGKINTYGGDSYTGSTATDFVQHNPEWVRSLNNNRNNWTLCDIPKSRINPNGFNESFAPIWELCEDEKRKYDLSKAFDEMNTSAEKEFLEDELYVTDIKIISGGDRNSTLEKADQNYILIDSDLNAGAHGKTIYLMYKLGHKKDVNPLTNFCIEVNKNPKPTTAPAIHPIYHDKITADYERYNTDLNWETKKDGDPYLYLNGTRDTRFEPIKRLNVIKKGPNDKRNLMAEYPEWTGVKVTGTENLADCNERAEGDYIYIIYKR